MGWDGIVPSHAEPWCWQTKSSWLLDIDRQSIRQEARIKSEIRVLKRELRPSKARSKWAMERNSNRSNNSSLANDSKFIFLFHLDETGAKSERMCMMRITKQGKKEWVTSLSMVFSYLPSDEYFFSYDINNCERTEIE